MCGSAPAPSRTVPCLDDLVAQVGHHDDGRDNLCLSVIADPVGPRGADAGETLGHYLC